jgi:uncharacterized membrane protein YtjA (UPF0391 family)
MARAAIGFFIVGLLAMAMGSYNVGGVSIEMGKMCLYVFLALSVLSFVVSLITGRRRGPL